MPNTVHFLGHVVSEYGVETDPDKIEKVCYLGILMNYIIPLHFLYIIDDTFRTLPLSDLLPIHQQRRNLREHRNNGIGQRQNREYL